MITSKYINILIAVVLLVVVVFTGIFMTVPDSIGIATENSQPEYVTKLFNKDKIISIDIKADKNDWENMLKNATGEEYIQCDATINGITYKSVGIRPKGNSSLSMVANSDSDRYSFKLEFDHYIKGQTCMGMDKMVINNIQADSTYMKEYLSLDMMSYIGVTTPLFAYTDVTINGEKWGFYLAVEAMEESFAERNYGDDFGKLYKPETMGDRGNGMMKDFPGNQEGQKDIKRENGNQQQQSEAVSGATAKGDGMNGKTKTADTKNNNQDQQKGANNQNQNQGANQGGPGGFPGGPGFGGFGNNQGGGADLKYIDDKISSYSNIFEGEIFKGTDADYKRVIKAIENLNNGTELEKYINVDECLRYFAVNTVVVNLDSYFSNMKHNYYLYEDNGQLSMLPWDYNLAFAGFQSGSASAAVNFPIDTPVSGIEMSERPILNKLLEVDEYKAKYHNYLQDILNGYFDNGEFDKKVDKLNSLIGEYVKNDSTAFFSYDKYTAGIAMLKEFGKLRAKSIQGQLGGSIPSTTQGQSKASDKLMDASAINLSVMGTQGGGGRMGKDGANQPQGKQQQGDNQMPQDGMKPPQGNQQQGDGQFTQGGMEPPQGNQQQGDGQMPQGGMEPPQGNQQQGDNQMPQDGMKPPQGNQQQGDGQMPPGNMQGFGDMPDRDVMMQAMKIIQSANGKDLTDEQLQQLKALGLTDEQINFVKNMSFGNGGMRGGGFQPPNGKNDIGTHNMQSATRMSGEDAVVLGVCLLFMSVGLLFVIKFKRRKSS
ncbi:CotH kinase family protein [Ruminiclostridium papyrosolvens]|uniref:Spore coat protein CotH n=1 Tax=Ruminiclostridium papyrosolvens C7 TaxID=1330534 RepID=U4R6L4_9FIRM|nr:CotH kinase family protein [Ruminiclostridium papyrosolvens]EPR14459.1 spore coat protein CotH [Ruminiclostridium papyrosolvens C7]